ncbi:hypothetical protein IFT64_12180 [Oxalobacteraceae sp. CFBP 8753]|nr:hypothetical protein [Oxalobacteraceae sp. CFBP 8753]
MADTGLSTAQRQLAHGSKYPYDGGSEAAPAIDWAHAAARGVMADLLDRRGVKWELEKVDIDVRADIVTAVAAIVRAAAPLPSTAPEVGDGAVLEAAARIAASYGSGRPIVERRPNDRILGRWEGEQAASANIARMLLERAALASRPAEVGDQIPRESNDALIALARYWKLNGDWMTCKGCRRSLIASRDGEELAHGDGCKYWDQQHPWAQLRKLITRRPAPAGAAQ